MKNGDLVGNWATIEEATDMANKVWGLGPESVESMDKPHDWKTCSCEVCKGKRQAHNELTIPTDHTP